MDVYTCLIEDIRLYEDSLSFSVMQLYSIIKFETFSLALSEMVRTHASSAADQELEPQITATIRGRVWGKVKSRGRAQPRARTVKPVVECQVV